MAAGYAGRSGALDALLRAAYGAGLDALDGRLPEAAAAPADFG